MSRNKINRLFIANRGEIAARITRSAKELGITTVITYTANDCNSLHVQLADKAVSLGNKSLSETYLSPEKMVEVAKNEQCDAVHPGYGFLSENDRFAELCQQNGLLFIGPSTQTIRKMGDKKEAKKLAQQCGVPVLENLVLSKESNINGSSIPEFPLLIKAVAGGGGKGMYIVENFKELDFKIEQAKRETINYFGNGQLYIETYIKNARHIEIQLLGDNFGNLIHLFERECSLQRRHQKIIEEAPASSISEGLRNKLIQAALKIGKAVNYSGAGTVEFLVDADENFYFLEMNTRIQVEHGVTEIVTGIDIVKEQLLIASGKKLSFRQEEIKISGFAIEARVYAENPLNNFIPVSGELVKIKFPETTGSRIDTHLQLPHHLPAEYDALLAKLIGFGESREMAKKQLEFLLNNTVLLGLPNTIPFLVNLLNEKEYVENQISTDFIENNYNRFSYKLTEQFVEAQFFVQIFYLIYHFQLKKVIPDNVWLQIGNLKNTQSLIITINGTPQKVVCTNYGEKIKVVAGNKQVLVEKFWLNQDDLVFLVENQKYMAQVYPGHDCTLIQYRALNFRVFSNGLLNEAKIIKTKQAKNSYDSRIVAPFFGRIIKINSKKGGKIKKGESLIILESMKIENHIICPADAVVIDIKVKEGNQVKENELLVELEF